MTSTLAKKAGLSVFEKHLKQYEPADPLYEDVVDPKSGKKKRRKRELPPGLSKRDAKILKKVKSRAHYLDKGFKICGMQFGWTFVIGIIPFAGDIVDAGLNYTLVIRPSRQAEIPAWLLQRMLLNNTISIGVGLIPLVGDVILATYKANSRNAALLEEFLRIRGEEFLKAQANHATLHDPNDVKPGAGRLQGEEVPGAASGSGFFGSMRKTKAAPGPSSSHAAAGNGAEAVGSSQDIGRLANVRQGKPVADAQARF